MENKTSAPENNLYGFLIKTAIIIWISGSIIFFTFVIISNVIFYKKLKRSRKHIHTNSQEINVFVSGVVNIPCISGIIHPSVYLPLGCSVDCINFNNENKYLKQVLAHEYTHIRHKDNIWTLLRTICLGIYWFHPFVWIAYFYSKRDAELACDEAVLRNCTDEEKYSYGRMLLIASQKGKQNTPCLATPFSSSKTNLKERITMLSNSGKIKYRKCYTILIAAVTVLLAGCTMTREKTTIENMPLNSPDNTINKTEETASPVTSVNRQIKYKTEKIFQDFINNQIKSRPEWRKWKGDTKDLYFSIQYITEDNIPCLLVTTDVITDTNETINAFVYYYDKEEENVELLTYLASNGTADPVKIKKGKFVITTHHSLRKYNWTGNGSGISADEVYGYFMDKENYTYSCFKWEVPFYNRKTSLDARKSYSKDKIDTYAYDAITIENFSKNKARQIYKNYSDANPVPFYSNTEENWKEFYNNGSFKGNIHRIVWHGNYNDDNDIITDIVNSLSYEDFIKAEEEYSILVNNARLHYSGKFSDEEVLYFLNWGYTLRAFILRTGPKKYASYDVYALDTSKWDKEDIFRDMAVSSNSHEIYTELRRSKLARADFDNDGETEIAFYITENPYTLNEYKTLYIFDPELYENYYKKYELYSYTKDDYRYFAEQVCINFDFDYGQDKYQQVKPGNYFADIKNKPDNSYHYKSKKNILSGNTLNDYNYIISDKSYKNNYEFGSKNNYNITLEDDKTEIKTSIGITYNKKGEKQKHNAEFSAVVKYKGNGKFVLKSPYYFKSLD